MGRWARVSSVLGVLLFLALAIPTRLYAVSPTISSLTPNSGALGASVSIAESGFGSTQGSSTVKFNGTSATTITSWSTSSIVALVPTGATTGNVVVTVSGRASNGVLFTVVPAPSITSLSPTSGPGGASVTISGSNFGASQGSVTFNGTQANITGWSATSIAVSVPSAATTGNVVAGSPSVPLVLYPKQSEEVVYA